MSSDPWHILRIINTPPFAEVAGLKKDQLVYAKVRNYGWIVPLDIQDEKGRRMKMDLTLTRSEAEEWIHWKVRDDLYHRGGKYIEVASVKDPATVTLHGIPSDIVEGLMRGIARREN